MHGLAATYYKLQINITKQHAGHHRVHVTAVLGQARNPGCMTSLPQSLQTRPSFTLRPSFTTKPTITTKVQFTTNKTVVHSKTVVHYQTTITTKPQSLQDHNHYKATITTRSQSLQNQNQNHNHYKTKTKTTKLQSLQSLHNCNHYKTTKPQNHKTKTTNTLLAHEARRKKLINGCPCQVQGFEDSIG